MREFIVYALFVEGEELPFYIGKTFKGSDRFYKHRRLALSKTKSYRASVIRQAFRAGKEILMQVLFSSSCEQEALSEEIRLISFYGRRDKGDGCLTNTTDGGEGTVGYIMSDEHKKALHEAIRGKPRSKETKEKIGLARRGKKLSPEHIAACKKGKVGLACPQKTRDALSKRYKGVQVSKLGPEASRVVCSKAVVATRLDGTKVGDYPSVADCARALGLLRPSITKVLLGQRKSLHGYVFRFI